MKTNLKLVINCDALMIMIVNTGILILNKLLEAYGYFNVQCYFKSVFKFCEDIVI